MCPNLLLLLNKLPSKFLRVLTVRVLMVRTLAISLRIDHPPRFMLPLEVDLLWITFSVGDLAVAN
ncbi:hypothetical protein Gohar_009043, partial [Gossypium harknessii]|nr:hypothetical protein [Gossypium harknessii]